MSVSSSFSSSSHSAIPSCFFMVTTTTTTITMEYSDASNDYIEEYQSIFTALETELLEVEHFFTEPNFTDDVFSLHKCLNDANTPADEVESIPDVFEDYLLDFVNDETSMPEKMDSTATGEVNSLARIFRFKTKPRGRNVKRGRPASYDYLKSFLEYRRFVAVYDDDDDGKRSEKRKKRHKSWSIPEVLKLVDGVSELGVGKWMEIKRLFFSSSHHRSAVDLKDKWRNLLRACRKLRRGQWVQGNASPTTPTHILCRVKELSMTHPYPRKRQMKINV